MIEASEYEALDTTFFSLERCSTGCLECSSITKTFTLYVDLLLFAYRRGLASRRAESGLHKLFKSIDDFEREACRVIAN